MPMVFLFLYYLSIRTTMDEKVCFSQFCTRYILFVGSTLKLELKMLFWYRQLPYFDRKQGPAIENLMKINKQRYLN